MKKNFKFWTFALIATTALSFLPACPMQSFAATSFGEQVKSVNYSFEEEVTSFSDLAVLSHELERFERMHPEASEAVKDKYLISFVEKGGLRNRISTQGLYERIPGVNNLNSTERALALKHPVQAVNVYNCANKATSATTEYYGYNGYQDNSDAFRHCCWNALLKKAIGQSAAKTWTDAHEADTPEGNDKTMDLYNNSVGLGMSVDKKSDSEIYEAVKSKVSGGKCYRIVSGKLTTTNADGLNK